MPRSICRIRAFTPVRVVSRQTTQLCCCGERFGPRQIYQKTIAVRVCAGNRHALGGQGVVPDSVQYQLIFV